MTGQESLNAARYEVVVLVGPAPETEVEDLMVAITELPECKKVGGVVTSRRPAEERCGWGNGYQDCFVDGCGFPAERCVRVRRERSEA